MKLLHHIFTYVFLAIGLALPINGAAQTKDVGFEFIKFIPNQLTVKSGKTAEVELILIDGSSAKDIDVRCSAGGKFSNYVFTAPDITQDTVSICRATVTGEGSATLTVNISATVKLPPKPVPDKQAPELSFTPNRLNLASGARGGSRLKAADNVGIVKGPDVSCTKGGSYSGSIFRAPTVTTPTVSICTAKAKDAASNVGQAQLRVQITPKAAPKRTPPKLSFNPPILRVRSGERAVAHFTVTDDSGIPRPPVITCTNGGSFNNPNFTAPHLLKAATSLCTASATNGLGMSGKAVLKTEILPPKTAPRLAFNPPSLALKAGESAPVSVIAPQGLKAKVSCRGGGRFDGTKFIAPQTKRYLTSECKALVTDAAGNKLESKLSVSINETSFNPLLWVLGGLGLLGVGALLWGVLRPKKSEALSSLTPKPLPTKLSMRPSKPLERPENTGTLFAGSPLLAANVAAPLSPAGQLTASHLQMLTGQFAVLKPAYQATGRIGYAQEGKPTSEDYSFGTGFLITQNHVMTNRHVHGFYGHYLTSDEDCGGIEFIAEKDKDASDFIPFNGEPPLLLEGLDIAIYTLSRAAGNRTPINRVPIPTDELEGRDIAVVGYPDTHDPNKPDILALVEDDPIFAVKRVSQGKIFRHSTDTDNPYGVEVNVNEDDKTKFPMQAICHNASTMGGNSGSPILDIKTGELLGVHFAGYKIFNKKEAANLAMAIAKLTEHTDIKMSDV